MNSNPFPQYQSQPQQQSSINPAFLAAFQQQQNAGNSSNKFPYGSVNSFNQQMLQQQQQPGSLGMGGVNPAQLMNGVGSLQQPQQQQQQQLNPTQLLQQQQPQQHHPLGLNLTREQFAALSPQDRQMLQAKMQQFHQQQQQQQQQIAAHSASQQQQHSFYGGERPSSSASSHAHGQHPLAQMMPPPPHARPQSQSQNPNSNAGINSNMNMNINMGMQQQRPPSRPPTSSEFHAQAQQVQQGLAQQAQHQQARAVNGYGQHQMPSQSQNINAGQNPYPHTAGHSQTPNPQQSMNLGLGMDMGSMNGLSGINLGGLGGNSLTGVGLGLGGSMGNLGGSLGGGLGGMMAPPNSMHARPPSAAAHHSSGSGSGIGGGLGVNIGSMNGMGSLGGTGLGNVTGMGLGMGGSLSGLGGMGLGGATPSLSQSQSSVQGIGGLGIGMGLGQQGGYLPGQQSQLSQAAPPLPGQQPSSVQPLPHFQQQQLTRHPSLPPPQPIGSISMTPVKPEQNAGMGSLGMRIGSLPPDGTGRLRGSLPPSGVSLSGDPFAAPVAAPSGPLSASTSGGPPVPSSSALSTAVPLPGAGPVAGVGVSTVGLPSGVTINPLITRVSVVPLAGSETAIPALGEEEIADVKGWLARDGAYEGVFRAMGTRMTAERARIDGRTAWWERDAVGSGLGLGRRREVFDVRYPRRKGESGRDRDGRERKGKPGRREGLRIPGKLDPEVANRPEQLVPIRLEFEVEHHKMRDSFVWNMNDPVVTPESFAQSVVDDYGLPPSYLSVITKAIQEQLNDFRAHIPGAEDGAESAGEDAALFSRVANGADADDEWDGRGSLGEEDVTWWETWRKRLRTGGTYTRAGRRAERRARRRKSGVVLSSDTLGVLNGVKTEREKVRLKIEPKEEKPVHAEELEVDEDTMLDDMRILIRLDIIVGSVKLDDQFEWDMDNPGASPEQFAEVYAKELGLGGEFKTAIAHSIREQVQIYQKSLFLVGHPADGSQVQDEDLRTSFLPSLSSGARALDEVQAFTPLLNYVSDGEIERSEREREKEMTKRRKRNTRGRRGVALPDREPIRTYRTPAIGFPDLDPATLALAVAAAAPTSRRAAAAAASLTIANMVASENGTTYIPQAAPVLQPPPTSLVSKEKKAKGMFKAPTYPPTVLRPRARVTAPTPSTAADVASLPPPLENDPPAYTAPPDSRGQRSVIPTARRVKELEREAKEREFVDGQHPNMIDGVWHCSNCGCPESIAVGRRKGPLGDKSQCGPCGKYWHRHRRPFPVEYSNDVELHVSRREAENAKTQVKKKAPTAARALAASTPIAEDNGETENKTADTSIELPASPSRAPSPAPSSASSGSESPLARRVRANGSASVSRGVSQPAPPVSKDGTSEQFPPPSSPPRMPSTPQWLLAAKEAMSLKYPDDRFEIILRKVAGTTSPEWRIKCLDCPGKLYTPGPGETLSNYEVHLKNRNHRQRVNNRVQGIVS